MERLDAEFRLDAFNVFNHANFGVPFSANPNTSPSANSPNTDINSPTFGQVSQTLGPRVVQIALHLRF
jgi:hypothetical protein